MEVSKAIAFLLSGTQVDVTFHAFDKSESCVIEPAPLPRFAVFWEMPSTIISEFCVWYKT